MERINRMNIEDNIGLLKKYHMVSESEIYDMATRAGDIDAKRVSDEQIALLTKFAENKFCTNDIKRFIKLQFEDNVFNFSRIPKLKYRDLLTTSAEYFNNIIAVSNDTVMGFEENHVSLAALINLIGHEWRHCLQHHLILNEIFGKDKNYYRKLMTSFRQDEDLDPVVINALYVMQYDICGVQTKISKFLQKYMPNAKFTKWYNSLSKYEKHNICFEITDSQYQQRICEEDARVGGLLYANLMISRLERDPRVQKNAKLYKYVKKNVEELSNLDKQYENCLSKYAMYQNFLDATSDLTFEMLEEMAKYIVRANKRYIREEKFNTTEIAITALFDVCANAYIQKFDYNQLQELEKKFSKDIFVQGKQYDFTTKRFIASRMLPNVMFEEAIKCNGSIDVVDAKLMDSIEKLFDLYLQNQEKHNFGKDDSFLLMFYCYNLLPKEKINQLFSSLSKQGRYIEICNMIDYNNLYNHGAGVVPVLDKPYEARVEDLVTTKYNTLISLSEKTLELDLSEEDNFNFTYAYFFEIESLLECTIPDMISNKSQVDPKKYIIFDKDENIFNYKALEKDLGIDISKLEEVYNKVDKKLDAEGDKFLVTRDEKGIDNAPNMC